jgi:hypothetical protein
VYLLERDTWNILELAEEDPEDPGATRDVYKNATYSKVGGGAKRASGGRCHRILRL